MESGKRIVIHPCGSVVTTIESFYKSTYRILNIFILIFTMDVGLTFSNYDPLRVLDSLFTSINLI